MYLSRYGHSDYFRINSSLSSMLQVPSAIFPSSKLKLMPVLLHQRCCRHQPKNLYVMSLSYGSAFVGYTLMFQTAVESSTVLELQKCLGKCSLHGCYLTTWQKSFATEKLFDSENSNIITTLLGNVLKLVVLLLVVTLLFFVHVGLMWHGGCFEVQRITTSRMFDENL